MHLDSPQMRSRSSLVICASLVLVVSSGCHHAHARGDDARSVELAMQDYAHALLDSSPDTVAARYAADGELVLPGMQPLHGPVAIRAFLAPLVGAVHVDSVTVASDRVSLSGDDARQSGRYHEVAGARGQPPQTYDGAFDATWRRGSDGRWRIVRMVMTPRG